MFGINGEVVVVLCVASLAWLVAARALPRARRAVFEATGDKVVVAGGGLGLLSAVAHIAATVTLAGLFAVLLFLVARAWLASLSDPQRHIESVVGFRDALDGVLDVVGKGSLWLWLVALIVLVGIWAMAQANRSRTRWQNAHDARAAALRASMADLGEEEIRQQAGDGAPDDEALRNRYLGYAARNRTVLEHCLSQPVVTIGEQQTPFSLLELKQLQRELLRQVESGEADDRDGAIAFAANIQHTVERIEAKIALDLELPDGSRRTCNLAESWPLIELDEPAANARLSAARRTQLVEAAVQQRMKQHVQAPQQLDRPEPELLSEWIATAMSSRAAVAGSSRLGRWSAVTATIALALSLLGFAGSSFAATLELQARTLQLSLLEQRDSAAVASAVAAVPPPPPEEDESDAAAADDDTTTTYVRTMLRTRVASRLLNQVPEAARRGLQRQAFQLASVDARRAVLGASERAAAPRLDAGADAQGFARAESAPHPAVALDETLDRRVAELRRNPHLWQKLRREAARPARASEAMNALFRTAFGERLPTDPVMVEARRAVADAAGDIASSGHAAPSADPPDHPGPRLLTAREQRLVNDFHANLPDAVEQHNARLRSGGIDTGSLNRVALRAGGADAVAANHAFTAARAEAGNAAGNVAARAPAASAAGNYAAAHPTASAGPAARASVAHYEKLFPASAVQVASASASAGMPHVPMNSARSFRMVRFSARVGGVVIGREPDTAASDVDVTDVGWRKSAGRLYLQLTVGERTVELGPYRPTIVHQALSYAADSRVVTTTLPLPSEDRAPDGGGEGIPTRRVVVHPALEDTALGCRAIEVDRFVDAFAFGGDPVPGTPQHRMRVMRDGVTVLGMFLAQLSSVPSYRQSMLLDAIGPAKLAGILEPVDETIRLCRQREDCLPVFHYTGLELGQHALRAYYDCVAGQGTNCLRTLRGMDVRHGYAVDSGVRERAFVVDREFRFMSAAAFSGETLWPLDFIVQAVPTVSDGDADALRDLQGRIAQEPFTFPEYADDLRTAVAAGVRATPGAQAVFDDMREFTLLQRLFRSAFNGDLGAGFPLEKLAQLQSATASAVKVVRHERWNHTAPFYAYMTNKLSLARHGLALQVATGVLPPSCATSVKVALAKDAAAPWPRQAALWELLAQLDTVCSGPALAVLHEVRTLRDSLRDEELIDEAIHIAQSHAKGNREPFVCPAL